MMLATIKNRTPKKHNLIYSLSWNVSQTSKPKINQFALTAQTKTSRDEWLRINDYIITFSLWALISDTNQFDWME